MEQIKIKYVRDIEKIEKTNVGDWIDLRCAEDTHLMYGEVKLIPLGIAMQLPEGYEAIVAPRSSTFKKYYVVQTNSVGIIDESYCGDDDEWKMPVLAFKDNITIKKNERICQFRLIKHQPEIEFVEVETLGNESRGGFGSTGKI